MNIPIKLSTPLLLQSTGPRRYLSKLIGVGALKGHNLNVLASALPSALVAAESPLNCLLNHTEASNPRVEDLIGVWTDLTNNGEHVSATLTVKDTPAGNIAIRILDEFIEDQRAKRPSLDVGVSLDCVVALNDDASCIDKFILINTADLVFQPASAGARFTHILAQAGLLPAPTHPEEPMTPTPTPEPPSRVNDHLVALAHATLAAKLATSNLPPPSIDAITARFDGQAPTPAAIDAAIEQQQKLVAALAPRITGHAPHDVHMNDGYDQAQAITDWMFGAPGAKLPEPEMRRPSNFYRAFTGDIDWHGNYDPTRRRFASANTTNLAGLAANAMNKVMVEQWKAVEAYRWFEQIVTVTPNDGSVQPMRWTTFGGLSNLPVVAQGATYSELTPDDAAESDNFNKHGAYVGITEEMFRNDDLQRMQAIPVSLANAAVRTRSAAVAAIFTMASGTGPTLDDDSTVLFHSSHGSNVQTTALSAAAWKAARLECFKHAELGSSKRLGLYPKFCLIPADLFDDALTYFGYGTGAGGYPGIANNDTNPYGVSRSPSDPRPIPIVVPEWTDANDWAYLVDPALHPVIMMSYAANPGGRSHPLPELFAPVSPLAGLIFTNDTLPIKVRDWWAAGVATWRGIGKRNVT